ncbi:MAG TPA: S41 family peptidase [Polyangia bacterium]|nr:S41 family peptidase [Polyangia bacterium]
MIVSPLASSAARPRAALASTALAALALGALACATEPPPEPAVPAPATAVASAPPPAAPSHLEPPPFPTATPPVTRERSDDLRTANRRAILDAAWRLVRDKHYDKRLGGVNWAAARARYEPIALAAPSEAAFYRALNQMIGELGQSHMMVTGPGADDDEGEAEAEELAPSSDDPTAAQQPPVKAAVGVGDPGLTVRVIENRPTITAVRPGSSAERQGLQPGFVVTQIGGREIRAATDSKRPLRPVEERFAVRRMAQRRLMGPAGTRVTLHYLDNDDRPGTVMLTRDEPKASAVTLGHLPALYPEVKVEQIHDVGVLSFNIFLLQPVMEDIRRAMAGFRARHTRALILDLRGNPGGQGAMAIPVAALFVDHPVTLGTLQFRDFTNTLVARPELGTTPFTGPLVILTDEGTASAAEMLAAGLQEAKRATVVGDTTLGAVLPSMVTALPGGAVMQFVVADFKTPKGVLLEGRGVQPDRRVVETRAALRTSHDPVLDAALAAIRTSKSR